MKAVKAAIVVFVILEVVLAAAYYILWLVDGKKPPVSISEVLLAALICAVIIAFAVGVMSLIFWMVIDRDDE